MVFPPLSTLQKQTRIILLVSAGVVIFLMYGIYSYYSLNSAFEKVSSEFSVAQEQFASTTNSLGQQLAQSKSENEKLIQLLLSEQGKNDFFASQIQTITGNVSTLQKLSQTDKELLQKYSKVYFLNENYTPSSLVAITTPNFLYKGDKIIQIHSSVWPYLQRLLQDANSQAREIKILSAFRSFGEQTSLKAEYKQIYGSGANKFSADQGYSEHQLGTAVDFTTDEIGATLDGFDETLAYSWLVDNGYKYGFVISYPNDNGFYQFEPWHWRFVGIKLANKLHQEKKFFYDLDQREIDQYLINIFD